MARTSRSKPAPAVGQAPWRAALYARLSREDRNKQESNSIANQKKLLESFLDQQENMELADFYVDDGFTGTNFERPGFLRMVADIKAGKVNCVIAKDLSRLGRNYIDVGDYLERKFPEQGVRFISVGDDMDSEKGPYDMLLPFKNILNEQYAKDISKKVRSSFKVKQQRGEFIGAFASYGYRKDPDDHNKLLIDPPAAEVVRRIFTLYEQGMGKIRIAKRLNEEKIPCPSEYKRLQGEKYHNGQRLDKTSYWTYATVHRILNNQMYAGRMEQGRAPRRGMHGKAKQLPREQWAVVEGTHEAIIPPDQWERVQSLLGRDTRTLDFEQNISPLAGFLRCGDCGRAMSKTNHSGGIYYCCGSYKQYGPTVCSRHGIAYRDLEKILLDDLNKVIAAVENLHALAREAKSAPKPTGRDAERARLNASLARVRRLRKEVYEDLKDGTLSKADYLQYKEDYQRQEDALAAQLKRLSDEEGEREESPWVEQLLKLGRLTELDRATVAETVKEILVFEDHVEITYNFSDDLGLLGKCDE